jgi:hypothetical protein
MTRTRATATSFGLFGRCVVTVVVLLVPGLGVALAMVAGGAMLADPFAVTSLVTSLGFAGWIVRLTWRPARSLRAPPR